MSDVILQRGVLNGPIKLVRTTGEPAEAQDLTGLDVRCQFRLLEDQYGTGTTGLLLSLDSADDDELYVDPDPTLGTIWLDLTVAQTLLLCPDNVRTKVAVGFELYDPADPDVLVYRFWQGIVRMDPEVPR